MSNPGVVLGLHPNITPDRTMPIGPTRVEVIGDLIDVVKADYTRAFIKKRSTCMDCMGAGVHVMDSDEGADSVNTCARCEGAGYEQVDEFDNENVPEDLRPFITGVKAGFKGKLLPEFRNKDKAASELMKAISNGWLADFKRDAYGADAQPEPVDMSREAVLAQYVRIASTADHATAMSALNAIAKLQGFVAEDDNGVDNQPLTLEDVTAFMNAKIRARGRKTADENVAAEAAARNGVEVDGEGNELEPMDPRDEVF